MMKNKIAVSFAVLAGALMFASIAKAQLAQGPNFYTLKNITYAYTDEINVSDRYWAYANRADEEGYPALGSLFRAVAMGELVHAKNHASIIKKLGGTLKPYRIAMDVKSTQENLTSASRGEFFEAQKLYSKFIQTAKDENMLDTVRTFTYAQRAENQHALLFSEALKDLELWKDGKRAFFVCSVCGYVTGSFPKEKCPSCGSSRDKFRRIS